jgi:transposase
MRFVVPGLDPGIKSAESQAGLMVLRVRELLVKQRTALINAIRGHAAEFGVTAAKGPVKVAELLQRALQRAQAEETGVPAPTREMLSLLAGQLDAVEARFKTLEGQLMAVRKENPASQCLATIPGVGPIGAVSFALRVPDPKAFRSGRHFAPGSG